MQPTISRTVRIAAHPRTVWSIVTDLTRMGDFSPENRGGRWAYGATGPAVGAEFHGVNRNGARRWWTKVRIIAYEPGRSFAFDVRTPFGVRVSRWRYDLAPVGAGCELTEHWYRVGNWFIRRFLGPRVTGRADRVAFNVESIERTLVAVKARAEYLDQTPATVHTGARR